MKDILKRQFFFFCLTAITTSFFPLHAEGELSLEEELEVLEKELALEEEKLVAPPSSLTVEDTAPKLVIESQTPSDIAEPTNLPSLEAIPTELPVLANDAQDMVVVPAKESPETPALLSSPPLSTAAAPLTPLEIPEEVQAEAPPLAEAATDNGIQEESLEEALAPSPSPLVAFEINFSQVFAGAPVIYSILLCMSIGALCIWLYNMLTLKEATTISETLLKHLRNKFTSNQYEEALSLCLQNESVFCKMLASGIATRKHGLHIMLETMRSEGQRATVVFWQRLALLNDIAIIAPMLGLLGTVMGMFYAFYDIHRSFESLSSFFDGLGVSVGTTVAGLIVAILALILHSVTKYRLVRHLVLVENEAQGLAALIEK